MISYLFSGLREAWQGGSVTWKQAAVLGLSELIGTALLVNLACMGCLPGFASGAPPVLQYSLSTGLVVMFVVQVTVYSTHRYNYDYAIDGPQAK